MTFLVGLKRRTVQILQSNKFNRLTGFVLRSQFARVMTCPASDRTLILWSPTARIRSRNSTLATKEPMTIRWLQSLSPEDVLWDIGANIGLYACFAAKSGTRVVAFEPSVFNMEALARNIFLNRVTSKVIVVPLPVSHIGSQPALLSFATDELGDSQTVFASLRRDNGEVLSARFESQVPGIALDDLIAHLRIPAPTHLKIDVDGNEPEILRSSPRTLKLVSQVLTEVPLLHGAREQIYDTLKSEGFQLVESSRRNELWCRV
jgi:FkbM family methyltransferase